VYGERKTPSFGWHHFNNKFVNLSAPLLYYERVRLSHCATTFSHLSTACAAREDTDAKTNVHVPGAIELSKVWIAILLHRCHATDWLIRRRYRKLSSMEFETPIETWTLCETETTIEGLPWSSNSHHSFPSQRTSFRRALVQADEQAYRRTVATGQ